VENVINLEQNTLKLCFLTVIFNI